MITELIKTARAQCEGYLCISMISKTVTSILNNSLGAVELPYGPVVTFTSLTDENGTAIVAADYTLRGLDFKYLVSPYNDYMTAIYAAGYTTLPVNLKTGLLQQIAWLYENRGDSKENMFKARVDNNTGQISPMALATLQPYRRVT